ncbi:Nitrate/nitrite transporter NarK [Pseudonocardia ammonioxydans]|uniref:Nitrate/nitrite transporter NarK n=1 Tax=Pseudonocardia ammonioxydans TaxID=260086 RepID=A0A1I4UJK1_PSUAM|nr:MFS transporter [Pseudonocardia ammonioxydans]SFM88930.1 Nitrate/nitrite transporter NarK [Pseudonocardia ammonioxydans]
MQSSQRAYLVWSAGLLAYIVAVLQRSSFGVAGLDAAERFEATPTVLAGFLVLQLLVYAALQVPVGLLLDRFGARAMVLAGAVTMTAAQVMVALVTSLPLAIVARVLVGVGDALTFISVLSVVSVWFPARRVPLMTQLTALLGQFGQVLSAIPLATLLHGYGWTTAFLAAAAAGLVAGIAVLAVFRDRPPGSPAPATAATPREVLDGLKDAWRHPGTRLGLWTHAGTQFSGLVFALLWGVPYLVAGQGMSTTGASVMLTVLVLAGAVVGPVFGEFTARHPLRRSWLVLSVIGATALVWAVVLLVPPPAPLWLLVLLVLVLAANGPSSAVGFDYARTFNPEHRRGTAVGIVNVGGFTASLTTTLLVGAVLGLAGGYTPEAFRIAWLVQFPIWAVTTLGVLATRRKARRVMAEEGTVVPPLREALRRNRRRRRDVS